MHQKIDVPAGAPVQVSRWPSEIPLRVAVMVVGILLWLLLIVGSFGLGLIYVGLIGAFLFLVQVGFIAHLRGSAVQLGPDQFPELYARVAELARKAGLKATPEAYILQADGGLNALATKFFRRRIIVLYADLLAACGDDEAARDMIIGHEIGHLRCGHLDWFLLSAPGRIIPFLGSAYSRACEYTCDRWGAALSGSPDGAKRGLAVLAAGGAHSRQVNLDAYVRQQQNLNTGWMTLARWLSTYPPLSARVAAIAPDPNAPRYTSGRGALRAWAIMLSFVLVPALIVMGIAAVRGYPGATSLLPAFVNGSSAPSSSSDQTFASVDDMPAPQEVPQIDDAALAEMAVQCHGGDMAACDRLYYESEGGSTEENYGNSCAGRFPGNPIDCVDYLEE
ncbi:M48 family metallopeptidase [Nitratireductor sp. ZSWI3]|uniref:M48 family metallopeptidase n=1 Tax=Nitratireductor sp. ZSWI3 TaxID=2966359 RepID=UPI00214FF688|nr:M48 family metalloprotease [Nitratireductor sp. ZSWI3]MCR4265409.1 M48 family metalloprotease [Nitratireductor sp. ZSWI3]